MNERTETPQRLDLRALDPPEPMRRALEAVEALAAGKLMEIITDREPLLLYRELGRRGHSYIAERRPDGFFTTIRRSQKRGAA
jgi:uncharacterized protein (DUF2249 family)